jgi:hypothetical protein
MARGEPYTDGAGHRDRDREPEYRDARSYYTDDDDEREKTPRSRHRTEGTDRERRRRRREKAAAEETRLADELDIQNLRAARAEYYSRPTDERQNSARRMAQAVEVERVSSRRGTPVARKRVVREGIASGSGTRRRKKRVEEEKEDDGFVYSREVRESARSPNIERTGTVKRVGTVRESDGGIRGARSMEAERPVREVERVVSTKRADPPKLGRYVDIRAFGGIKRVKANFV